MRELRLWPDPILTRPTHPITKFDDKLYALVNDMYEVIEKFGGVGLAAPQVGERFSVIVYSCDGEKGVLINPTLTPTPDAKEEELGEGCLSLPGVYIKVKRPNIFDLKWQDETGIEYKDEFYGLLATVIQHELDHLQGRTLVHYLSRTKRDLVTRKMKKIQRRKEQYLRRMKKEGRLDELQATQGQNSGTE